MFFLLKEVYNIGERLGEGTTELSFALSDIKKVLSNIYSHPEQIEDTEPEDATWSKCKNCGDTARIYAGINISYIDFMVTFTYLCLKCEHKENIVCDLKYIFREEVLYYLNVYPDSDKFKELAKQCENADALKALCSAVMQDINIVDETIVDAFRDAVVVKLNELAK